MVQGYIIIVIFIENDLWLASQQNNVNNQWNEVTMIVAKVTFSCRTLQTYYLQTYTILLLTYRCVVFINIKFLWVLYGEMNSQTELAC